MAKSREEAVRAVGAVFDRYHLINASKNHNGFDSHHMSNLKIIDASPSGTASYEFLICEKYANLSGGMHGGAGGVIFDMCTTFALGPVGKPGSWDFLGSVTRTLNLSYLKAVPVGTFTFVQSFIRYSAFKKSLAFNHRFRHHCTNPCGSNSVWKDNGNASWYHD